MLKFIVITKLACVEGVRKGREREFRRETARPEPPSPFLTNAYQAGYYKIDQTAMKQSL